MKPTAILNRFKRIFNSHFLNSYLLLAVCLFGFSRVQAQTKQPLGGGAWGEKGNLFTWSLSSDSVLTIEGSGPMPLDSTILNNPYPPEYYYVDQLIPWYERFSAIKTVVINKDITSICMYAFYGCNNLVSITIPNSVNSIGRFAFSDCNRLPSIVIPEKVASIGTQAFRRCYNLTSIFVRNPTPPTVGALAFEFVPNTAKLYIINGQDSISSKEAYKKAPFWERFSANITAFVAKLHITLSSPDVWLSSTGDTIRLSTGATGDTIRLTTGDTIRLSAELWPKDADSSTATRDDSILIWSSADSLIAVVSDSNLVTVAGDLQKYNVKEKDVYIKVETKSGKIADSCLVRVIKSNVAALSSLYVNKGALVPPFDPDNTEYTVVVANSVSDITVEAEAANHPKATVSANSTWSLKVGENVLTVRVTAENGDTRDYTVRVTRQPNNNAALRDLTISSGKLIPLIPEFHSMRTDYTAVVANSVSEIRVNAVATREGAAVSAADSTWSLKVGDNRLTVTVTAEDGGYTADYTVKVRRQSSDVALERNIIVIDSVSNDTTILAGSDNGFDYAGSVPNSVSTVRVVVKTNHPDAVVTGAGYYRLNIGVNNIPVTVTAEDIIYRQNYSVTITRMETSNDATLSRLTVGGGELYPPFSPDNHFYTAFVTDPADIMIMASTSHSAAAVSLYDIENIERVFEIENIAETGFQKSWKLEPEDAADKTFNIVVTAETGVQKAYGITLTRSFTGISQTGKPVESRVSLRRQVLHVDSPAAERINIYSVTGTLLYGTEKPAGKASFAVSPLARPSTQVLIVRGSSGWAAKLVPGD